MTAVVTDGWELKPDDIIEGDVIGRGSFGVVRRGTLHGMDIAIKVIAASSPKEKKMAATMLKREVAPS